MRGGVGKKEGCVGKIKGWVGKLRCIGGQVSLPVYMANMFRTIKGDSKELESTLITDGTANTFRSTPIATSSGRGCSRWITEHCYVLAQWAAVVISGRLLWRKSW